MDKPTDYGLDFKVDIVRERQVTGENFSLQLKSHEKLPKGKPITAILDRQTINLYLARLEPMLIVCYVAEHQDAYYTWFTERTVDLTKPNKSYSIRFNSTNKISTLDWNNIVSRVDEIFSRRFLLHSFPEFKFSEMDVNEKDAAAHYLKRDYETALYLFKQLQKKNSSGCWLNSIAMCHYALYQYKDALVCVNQALALADIGEIRLNKGSILAEYGIELGNKAMVLEAREIFKAAVNRNANAVQYYNYANTLGWLGESELAKANYNKALKLNPNYAEAWKNLGDIYCRNNNSGKGSQCYDNALAISPELPQALMAKGMLLVREKGDYALGMDYLNRTIAADPGMFEKYNSGYFWFAHACFKMGDTKTGLNYLQNGLQHYPGDPFLLNLKRDYYRDSWRDSEELKEQAKNFMHYRLELSPQDAISLECLYRIYHSEGDDQKAMDQIGTYTALFRRSLLVGCIDEGFDIEPFLSSLYNYDLYRQFRHDHPLEKDLNVDLSPTFYFELNELLGLKIFHECVEYIRLNRTEKKFETRLVAYLFDQALIYYPISAPHMLTVNTQEKKEFGYQLCNAIIHIPILAIREIARINGYLSIFCKLNQERMKLAINKFDEGKFNAQLSIACAEEIQNKYHYFPED